MIGRRHLVSSRINAAAATGYLALQRNRNRNRNKKNKLSQITSLERKKTPHKIEEKSSSTSSCVLSSSTSSVPLPLSHSSSSLPGATATPDASSSSVSLLEQRLFDSFLSSRPPPNGVGVSSSHHLNLTQEQTTYTGGEKMMEQQQQQQQEQALRQQLLYPSLCFPPGRDTSPSVFSTLRTRVVTQGLLHFILSHGSTACDDILLLDSSRLTPGAPTATISLPPSTQPQPQRQPEVLHRVLHDVVKNAFLLTTPSQSENSHRSSHAPFNSAIDAAVRPGVRGGATWGGGRGVHTSTGPVTPQRPFTHPAHVNATRILIDTIVRLKDLAGGADATRRGRAGAGATSSSSFSSSDDHDINIPRAGALSATAAHTETAALLRLPLSILQYAAVEASKLPSRDIVLVPGGSGGSSSSGIGLGAAGDPRRTEQLNVSSSSADSPHGIFPLPSRRLFSFYTGGGERESLVGGMRGEQKEWAMEKLLTSAHPSHLPYIYTAFSTVDADEEGGNADTHRSGGAFKSYRTVTLFIKLISAAVSATSPTDHHRHHHHSRGRDHRNNNNNRHSYNHSSSNAFSAAAEAQAQRNTLLNSVSPLLPAIAKDLIRFCVQAESQQQEEEQDRQKQQQQTQHTQQKQEQEREDSSEMMNRNAADPVRIDPYEVKVKYELTKLIKLASQLPDPTWIIQILHSVMDARRQWQQQNRMMMSQKDEAVAATAGATVDTFQQQQHRYPAALSTDTLASILNALGGMVDRLVAGDADRPYAYMLLEAGAECVTAVAEEVSGILLFRRRRQRRAQKTSTTEQLTSESSCLNANATSTSTGPAETTSTSTTPTPLTAETATTPTSTSTSSSFPSTQWARMITGIDREMLRYHTLSGEQYTDFHSLSARGNRSTKDGAAGAGTASANSDLLLDYSTALRKGSKLFYSIDTFNRRQAGDGGGRHTSSVLAPNNTNQQQAAVMGSSRLVEVVTKFPKGTFGPSWHVAVAFRDCGRPIEAAQYCSHFVIGSAHMFTQSMPQHIQQQVLSIAESLGSLSPSASSFDEETRRQLCDLPCQQQADDDEGGAAATATPKRTTKEISVTRQKKHHQHKKPPHGENEDVVEASIVDACVSFILEAEEHWVVPNLPVSLVIEHCLQGCLSYMGDAAGGVPTTDDTLHGTDERSNEEQMMGRGDNDGHHARHSVDDEDEDVVYDADADADNKEEDADIETFLRDPISACPDILLHEFYYSSSNSSNTKAGGSVKGGELKKAGSVGYKAASPTTLSATEQGKAGEGTGTTSVVGAKRVLRVFSRLSHPQHGLRCVRVHDTAHATHQVPSSSTQYNKDKIPHITTSASVGTGTGQEAEASSSATGAGTAPAPAPMGSPPPLTRRAAAILLKAALRVDGAAEADDDEMEVAASAVVAYATTASATTVPAGLGDDDARATLSMVDSTVVAPSGSSRLVHHHHSKGSSALLAGGTTVPRFRSMVEYVAKALLWNTSLSTSAEYDQEGTDLGSAGEGLGTRSRTRGKNFIGTSLANTFSVVKDKITSDDDEGHQDGSVVDADAYKYMTALWPLFLSSVESLLEEGRAQAAADLLLRCPESIRHRIVPVQLLWEAVTALTSMISAALAEKVRNKNAAVAAISVDATVTMMSSRTSSAYDHGENERLGDDLGNEKELMLSAMIATRNELQCCLDDAEAQVVASDAKGWFCHGCGVWNRRSGLGWCRSCQTLRWPLRACDNCDGLTSADQPTCQICDAPGVTLGDSDEYTAASPAQNHNSIDNNNSSSTFKPLPSGMYLLKPWSCLSCGHKNAARHSLFCIKCRAASPLLPAVKKTTCVECGVPNEHGRNRPWCDRCGTLDPSVGSYHRVHNKNGGASSSSMSSASTKKAGGLVGRAGLKLKLSVTPTEDTDTVVSSSSSSAAALIGPYPASLWVCGHCNTCNPWLLSTCTACWSFAEGHEIVRPWVQWRCGGGGGGGNKDGQQHGCGRLNPPWAHIRCVFCKSLRDETHGNSSSAAIEVEEQTKMANGGIDAREKTVEENEEKESHKEYDDRLLTTQQKGVKGKTTSPVVSRDDDERMDSSSSVQLQLHKDPVDPSSTLTPEATDMLNALLDGGGSDDNRTGTDDSFTTDTDTAPLSSRTTALSTSHQATDSGRSHHAISDDVLAMIMHHPEDHPIETHHSDKNESYPLWWDEDTAAAAATPLAVLRMERLAASADWAYAPFLGRWFGLTPPPPIPPTIVNTATAGMPLAAAASRSHPSDAHAETEPRRGLEGGGTSVISATHPSAADDVTSATTSVGMLPVFLHELFQSLAASRWCVSCGAPLDVKAVHEAPPSSESSLGDGDTSDAHHHTELRLCLTCGAVTEPQLFLPFDRDHHESEEAEQTEPLSSLHGHADDDRLLKSKSDTDDNDETMTVIELDDGTPTETEATTSTTEPEPISTTNELELVRSVCVEGSNTATSEQTLAETKTAAASMSLSAAAALVKQHQRQNAAPPALVQSVFFKNFPSCTLSSSQRGVTTSQSEEGDGGDDEESVDTARFPFYFDAGAVLAMKTPKFSGVNVDNRTAPGNENPVQVQVQQQQRSVAESASSLSAAAGKEVMPAEGESCKDVTREDVVVTDESSSTRSDREPIKAEPMAVADSVVVNSPEGTEKEGAQPPIWFLEKTDAEIERLSKIQSQLHKEHEEKMSLLLLRQQKKEHQAEMDEKVQLQQLNHHKDNGGEDDIPLHTHHRSHGVGSSGDEQSRQTAATVEDEDKYYAGEQEAEEDCDDDDDPLSFLDGEDYLPRLDADGNMEVVSSALEDASGEGGSGGVIGGEDMVSINASSPLLGDFYNHVIKAGGEKKDSSTATTSLGQEEGARRVEEAKASGGPKKHERAEQQQTDDHHHHHPSPGYWVCMLNGCLTINRYQTDTEEAEEGEDDGMDVPVKNVACRVCGNLPTGPPILSLKPKGAIKQQTDHGNSGEVSSSSGGKSAKQQQQNRPLYSDKDANKSHGNRTNIGPDKTTILSHNSLWTPLPGFSPKDIEKGYPCRFGCGGFIASSNLAQLCPNCFLFQSDCCPGIGSSSSSGTGGTAAIEPFQTSAAAPMWNDDMGRRLILWSILRCTNAAARYLATKLDAVAANASDKYDLCFKDMTTVGGAVVSRAHQPGAYNNYSSWSRDCGMWLRHTVVPLRIISSGISAMESAVWSGGNSAGDVDQRSNQYERHGHTGTVFGCTTPHSASPCCNSTAGDGGGFVDQCVLDGGLPWQGLDVLVAPPGSGHVFSPVEPFFHRSSSSSSSGIYDVDNILHQSSQSSFDDVMTSSSPPPPYINHPNPSSSDMAMNTRSSTHHPAPIVDPSSHNPFFDDGLEITDTDDDPHIFYTRLADSLIALANNKKNKGLGTGTTTVGSGLAPPQQQQLHNAHYHHQQQQQQQPLSDAHHATVAMSTLISDLVTISLATQQSTIIQHALKPALSPPSPSPSAVAAGVGVGVEAEESSRHHLDTDVALGSVTATKNENKKKKKKTFSVLRRSRLSVSVVSKPPPESEKQSSSISAAQRTRGGGSGSSASSMQQSSAFPFSESLKTRYLGLQRFPGVSLTPLRVALRGVELLNRTTTSDPIGWEMTSRLMAAVREPMLPPLSQSQHQRLIAANASHPFTATTVDDELAVLCRLRADRQEHGRRIASDIEGPAKRIYRQHQKMPIPDLVGAGRCPGCLLPIAVAERVHGPKCPVLQSRGESFTWWGSSASKSSSAAAQHN